MSELKNSQGVNEYPVDETTDAATEPDPFSSLNKLFEQSPEFKKNFDSVMSILSDDADEETTEVECVEIDGHDYIIVKTIEIAGTTYLYLINEHDLLDFMFQKVVVEDGEEYITDLDSEKEFDLVHMYFQRDVLTEIKEKLKSDREDKPDNP